MKDFKHWNFLIVGVDAAQLALSAKEAGFNVFAVDHFGDEDVKRACKCSLSIVKQKAGKSCGRFEDTFDPNKYVTLTERMTSKYKIDGILLASGLEDYPKVIENLNTLAPIIGNSPETIKKVRDRMEFFNQLKRIGISHPETKLVKSIEEARIAAETFGFPVLIKPLEGFGGFGIRRVESQSTLESTLSTYSKLSLGVLIQRFVYGHNLSVSFLSSETSTAVLTLNEQLLGIRKTGQREAFGYSGNVVPVAIDCELGDTCREVARNISTHFNLLGTNGIDFVVSKDLVPYIIEVNPRFQGTLRCVERVVGINLVNAHIQACMNDSLPTLKPLSASRFFVRFVLYSLSKVVAPTFQGVEGISDVPLPGVVIEEGEPLCSVFSEGETRETALENSKRLAELVYEKSGLCAKEEGGIYDSDKK